MELFCCVCALVFSFHLWNITNEISRVADAIEDLNEICFDEILEQIGE